MTEPEPENDHDKDAEIEALRHEIYWWKGITALFVVVAIVDWLNDFHKLGWI